MLHQIMSKQLFDDGEVLSFDLASVPQPHSFKIETGGGARTSSEMRDCHTRADDLLQIVVRRNAESSGIFHVLPLTFWSPSRSGTAGSQHKQLRVTNLPPEQHAGVVSQELRSERPPKLWTQNVVTCSLL